MFKQLSKLRGRAEETATRTFLETKEAVQDSLNVPLPEDASLFEKGMDKVTRGMLSAGVALSAAMPQGAYATEAITTKLTATATSFWLFLESIATILVACVLGLGWVMKIIIKNDRKVEMWTAWQQRAVLSWLAFKFTRLAITYLTELAGANGTTTPWTTQ